MKVHTEGKRIHEFTKDCMKVYVVLMIINHQNT